MRTVRLQGGEVRRALAVAAVGLAVAGCSGGSDGPDPSPSAAAVSQTVADDAVLGVCDAIAALPEDPDGAEAAFLDRAHQAIHLVAAAVQPLDPATAGELLVAKQAVGEGSGPSELLEQAATASPTAATASARLTSPP